MPKTQGQNFNSGNYSFILIRGSTKASAESVCTAMGGTYDTSGASPKCIPFCSTGLTTVEGGVTKCLVLPGAANPPPPSANNSTLNCGVGQVPLTTAGGNTCTAVSTGGLASTYASGASSSSTGSSVATIPSSTTIASTTTVPPTTTTLAVILPPPDTTTTTTTLPPPTTTTTTTLPSPTTTTVAAPVCHLISTTMDCSSIAYQLTPCTAPYTIGKASVAKQYSYYDSRYGGGNCSQNGSSGGFYWNGNILTVTGGCRAKFNIDPVSPAPETPCGGPYASPPANPPSASQSQCDALAAAQDWSGWFNAGCMGNINIDLNINGCIMCNFGM